MSDIEAIEVLTQAKERLFEKGWGRGTPAFRQQLGYSRENMCLEEAMCGDYSRYVNGSGSRKPGVSRAGRYVERAIGWYGRGKELWEWNDSQASAAVIFDAIDRAIEIAKESPPPAA